MLSSVKELPTLICLVNNTKIFGKYCNMKKDLRRVSEGLENMRSEKREEKDAVNAMYDILEKMVSEINEEKLKLEKLRQEKEEVKKIVREGSHRRK